MHSDVMPELDFLNLLKENKFSIWIGAFEDYCGRHKADRIINGAPTL